MEYVSPHDEDPPIERIFVREVVGYNFRPIVAVRSVLHVIPRTLSLRPVQTQCQLMTFDANDERYQFES